jgi:hypothetical protein
MITDLAEGRSEERNVQCRWVDRVMGRADCTFETRFKPEGPGIPETPWSSWSRSTVRFRHLGERGWCWFERVAENDLTESPASPEAPRR